MANMNIEEFRRIYEEWKKSGQSIHAFSESTGIGVSKFFYWQRKLRSLDRQLTKSRSFIELSASGYQSGKKENPTPFSSTTPALCEIIYPNGVMVRVTSDLSLDGLQQLINLSK